MTFLLSLLLATALGQSATPAPPSATQRYVQALMVMNALPEPSRVSFTTTVDASGMGFEMVEYDGKAGFAIGWGGHMSKHSFWHADYDARNDQSTVTIRGKRAMEPAPLFDPTWMGAQDWLRYGFDGLENPNTPVRSSAQPSAAPATDAQSGLRTIATVHALSPGAYRIVDDGPMACADGSEGRHLHLIALGDLQTHPLTDAVIDDSSGRFCTMDFRSGAPNALSVRGAFELHFGQTGPYWLVQDGTADFQMRVLGISAQHAHLIFHYSDVIAGS